MTSWQMVDIPLDHVQIVVAEHSQRGDGERYQVKRDEIQLAKFSSMSRSTGRGIPAASLSGLFAG